MKNYKKSHNSRPGLNNRERKGRLAQRKKQSQKQKFACCAPGSHALEGKSIKHVMAHQERYKAANLQYS